MTVSVWEQCPYKYLMFIKIIYNRVTTEVKRIRKRNEEGVIQGELSFVWLVNTIFESYDESKVFDFNLGFS